MRQNICLIVVFMSVLSFTKGQCEMQRVYDYDAAGNRILRSICVIPPYNQAPPQESMDSQSDGNDAEDGKESEKANGAEMFYVDKVGNISLKIFPNPATSIVRLEITGELAKIDGVVILYDLTGATIGSQLIRSYYTEIDMSSYPAATYLATVQINGKTGYWKIVKN